MPIVAPDGFPNVNESFAQEEEEGRYYHGVRPVGKTIYL